MRAINDYYELDYNFYYWRTVAGVEIDFIAHGPRGFFAFEIKNSKVVSPIDTKALVSFKADYPEVTPYLIYNGEMRQNINGIIVLPMLEALTQLPLIMQGTTGPGL